MSDIKGYMTEEQVHKTIEAADNDRDRLFLFMLWRFGRRVSELILVKKGDIDFEQKHIVFTTLKRNKGREMIVPLDPITLQKLKEFTKEMKADDRLFDFTRQRAFQIVRKCCKRAGIEKIGKKSPHPHHYRHSMIVHLQKKKWPLEEIQKLTGHSSINSLSFYLQFSTNEMREKLVEVWKDEEEWTKKVLFDEAHAAGANQK